jgi:hypothetical protein
MSEKTRGIAAGRCQYQSDKRRGVMLLHRFTKLSTRKCYFIGRPAILS